MSVSMFLTGGVCSLWSKNGVIKSDLDQASPSIMVIFHQDSKKLPYCLAPSLTLEIYTAQCTMINHIPRPPFLQLLCSAYHLASVFPHLCTWNTISWLWLWITLCPPTFERLTLLSIAVHTILDVMFLQWTKETNKTEQTCSQTVPWVTLHTSVTCNALPHISG